MKAKESTNKAVISALAITLWAILAVQVSAQTAPDATDRGPTLNTSSRNDGALPRRGGWRTISRKDRVEIGNSG